MTLFQTQVAGLARSLRVDLDKGLSEDEEDIKKRGIAFGTNTYPAARRTPFWVSISKLRGSKGAMERDHLARIVAGNQCRSLCSYKKAATQEERRGKLLF